ncbi:Hsp70 family protein [Mycoplasmopsis cynos]|uniref:Hsp70 family protein n=1 Tax=Mycoplasmopsis cynos TaxID=171284 RepID=UPI003A5C88F2
MIKWREFRLKEAAEKAKIDLSSQSVAIINLPFLAVTENGPLNVELELKRSEFESMTSHLLDRTRKANWRCIKRSGVTAKDLHEVLLVGGSTRMPSCSRYGKKNFR